MNGGTDMENKKLRLYMLFAVLLVLAISAYPLYMGFCITVDMIRNGTVYAENYPKYIIPYTPIAIAVIVGVALIPLLLKHTKKLAFLNGSVISVAVFFISEFMFETMVTITRSFSAVFPLESWQMYACYVPPTQYVERTWTEVDVLMGEYSPAFKLHFYLISVIIIIALLNGFYGFAAMIKTGEKRRKTPLILQSAAAVAFLGMCVWACFTAFYRNGAIYVSPLSATLMCVFFILMGFTAGLFVASFTLGKNRFLSVVLPALSASAVTLVMYIGEMILLSGHLYRFGHGFFLDGLSFTVFAPVDILVIILSGAATAAVALLLGMKTEKSKELDS